MHFISELSDPENQDQANQAMETEESPETVENGEDVAAEGEGNLDDLSEDEIEYLALDKQLDDLNRALDVLEQKNDNIHAQLKMLLETNQEVKKTFEANITEQK